MSSAASRPLHNHLLANPECLSVLTNMLYMTSQKVHHDEATNGGIFEGFEGYKTSTRSDHVSVLQEGLVVLDANVLLDLYRYGKQGRDDLIAALTAIGSRLWVPNQAMEEFWRNREGVLKDPGGTAQLIRTLASSEEALVKAITLWGKQRSHSPEAVDDLVLEVTNSVARIRAEVQEVSQEETDVWARDTSRDEVLQALNKILDGKVGGPLSRDAYEAALTESKRRGDNQIPPGFLDAKKPEPESAGDYLVWEQMLIETGRRQVDVLFITRDAKDDWVRREGGEIRGPRMELTKECLLRTGRRLFLRTPAQLLDLATDSLNVSVHNESVENANRLSHELSERELNGYGFARGSDIDFERNYPWAETLLKELQEINPTAATALKLAAVGVGQLDTRVLARLHITPSPENVEEVVASIDSVIGELISSRRLPERALITLVPVFDGSKEWANSYEINPAFVQAIRAASLSGYVQKDFPMPLLEIEADLVGRHRGEHAPWKDHVDHPIDTHSQPVDYTWNSFQQWQQGRRNHGDSNN